MTDKDLVKKHIILAVKDIMGELPKTHEEVVEYLREYFVDQKIEVFSRFITKHGEPEFREAVKEAVVESGRYAVFDDGQVRPVG